MSNVAKQIIFTSQPDSETISLNELFSIDPSIKFVKWLTNGVGMVDITWNFGELTQAIKINPPIFIQHICPVDFTIDIGHNADNIGRIAEPLTDITAMMDKNKSFSVQTRLLGKMDFEYKVFDVNQYMADEITKNGFNLDVRCPEQVISVVCCDGKAYIGISDARDNLSNWAGGRHRFIRNENLICRAEFKLLEAIDVFDLKLEKYKMALDLGAAPGGWTNVLRQHNLQVAAVDPADLHPAIISDPGVIHYKQTAQVFLKSNKIAFDVIVNDMKMDARESALLLGTASGCLKHNGIAVITLKLPNKNKQKIVKNTLELLRKWYEVIGARQLFHNRSEVTVILKPVML